MTESHIRINLTNSWTALQNLKGSVYKVLMCLAAHADNAGRCFPSADTIAFETHLNVQTVYPALKELLTYGYTRILEKAYFNPITGRKSPTVWQVSPYFLELADNMKEFAINLWNNFAEDSIESFSFINQQQNHVPETMTNNQYQKQQQQAPERAKSEPPKATAKPQEQPRPDKQPSAAPQRSLPTQPSALVKSITSHEQVREAFEDNRHEMLAKRVNEWGVPIAIARALINHYGFQKCFAVADYTEYTATRQTIYNPGGFWRDIVQNDIRVNYVMQQERDYTYVENDEFLEQ